MWLTVSMLLVSAQVAVASGDTAAAGGAIDAGKAEVAVRQVQDGRVVEACRVGGGDIAYEGAPGAVMLADGAWLALDHGTVMAETDLAGKKTVVVMGSTPTLEWKATYWTPAEGLVSKQLWVRAVQPVTIRKVAAGSFHSSLSPEIVSTGLQDIAVFLHDQERGLFLSLDFPYSRIVKNGAEVMVTYPPEKTLQAGEAMECHSLTFGATRKSGVLRYGRDTGDVDAMDSYVQNRFPNRFERPMFVSASINNRYTMPSGDIVFQTYKDHPTLGFNLDLLRREMDLLPSIGMQYYQVFPGVFDWAPDDPKPDDIKQIVKYGAERGVLVGDYSGTSSVFCPHYNEYRNVLDKLEWRMRDAKGNAGGFCFGCREFAEYYAKAVAGAAREYGFKIHCLDFLSIAPCSAAHGHPAGEESVYHQVAGLVHVMQALADTSPEMMVWSNSGNWAEFLPKIAWWNPNLYITDPYIAVPWQGLNMTRLLDDARREQMAAMHYKAFIPYRYFTNCQYFFSQNSVVPDIRNYEYGALSTIAMVPNLCLAEVRPWMDRLSARDAEAVKAFYTKWTRLVQENFALWKKTWHVGDDPAPGGIEVYGHTDGARGFIFIVNPNYWSADVEVPLDARLGLTAKGPCELKEIYPSEQYVLTSAGPTPEYGTVLRFKAVAQQVRVMEVIPAQPVRPGEPRVYGIPSAVTKSENGYLLRTHGAQGTAHRFCVVTADNDERPLSVTARDDEPKQPKRLFAKTGIESLGNIGNACYFELTYRRAPAPTELREWRIQSGALGEGVGQGWPKGMAAGAAVTLPLSTHASGKGTVADFQGAYIDNALSEEQDTLLDVRRDGVPKAYALTPGPAATQGEGSAFEGTAFWAETHFGMPFVYTIGAEPAFDEHTVIVFPMIDPMRVKDMKAWLNGAPLDVRRYAYPRNRALATWWADLVGSSVRPGDNTLVVYLEY